MITEKQKMLTGELYKDSDPELVAERRRAQQLVGEFNATRDDAVIKELFGSIGEGSWVMPRLQCDYGYRQCGPVRWGFSPVVKARAGAESQPSVF